LRLRGNQYDIALTVFFVSYVAVEIPSNLALKWLKPHRWVPFDALDDAPDGEGLLNTNIVIPDGSPLS